MNKPNREKFCEDLGWKIIFHYVGYLGMLTLFYWLIQIVIYYSDEKENKFFSVMFYKINYYFGWFYSILILFSLISILI